MTIERRLAILTMAGCFALVFVSIAGAAEPTVPLAFQTLKPGAVEPTGWLRDWAVSARNGITGPLDERSPTFELGWSGKDSRHDVQGFSAWVGVSDLVNWFYGSVGRNTVYATNLCQVTTGGAARFDPLEIRLRGIANP